MTSKTVDRFPIDKLEDLSQFEKFDVEVSRSTKVYGLVQYVLNAVVSLLLLVNLAQFPALHQLAIIAVVVLGSLSTGFVLEGREWGMRLDAVKYLLMLAIFYLLGASAAFFLVLAIAALVSLLINYLWVEQSSISNQSDIEIRENTRA